MSVTPAVKRQAQKRERTGHATETALITFKRHRLFRDMLCVKFPTFCGRNPGEVCVTTLSLNWISLFKSGKELN